MTINLIFKDSMTDNIVEIARFGNPVDAQILLTLLRSEGIECHLRNELTAQLLNGYIDTGGAIVDVLESDVPRALAIMKEGGYNISSFDLQTENRFKFLASLTEQIPLIKNCSTEFRIVFLLLLVSFILVVILFAFIRISYAFYK